MKRKLTSILLMSALLVGGASTFVSCKDYDGDQAAQTFADLKELESQVNTKIEALEGVLNGKQNQLPDDVIADLGKLHGAIDNAKEAKDWVDANSDLEKLTAKVEALATLANDQETLSKLAAMTSTWGEDFQNVVVKSELLNYVSWDDMQNIVWPQAEAMFEKKEDLAKDVEAVIDSITKANAENFTSYADLVAAFDKVPARLETIEGQIDDILAWNDNIQFTLDNMITGVNVDMVENPYFGTLNTPFGIKSTMLIGFVGGEISADDLSDFGVKDGKSGLATSLDGGNIYFTVNPSNLDASHLKFNLVGRDGEEAPGFMLSPAKVNNKQVTTIGTRAVATNGYVATAGINDGKAAQVVVDKDDLKAVAKNVLGKLKGQEGLDVTNAVRTIYSTFAKAIPQYYALQAEYKVKGQDGVEKDVAYTSDYNIAAVTIKPLGFNTLNNVNFRHIPQIPLLQEWLNANIVGFTYDPIDVTKIKDVDVEVPDINNVKVSYTGAGASDGKITVPGTGGTNVTIDFTKITIKEGENKAVVTVKLDDLRRVVADLNNQVETIVGNVNSLIDKADNLAGRADKYINKVNSLISTVNKFIDNSAQYLQPMMVAATNGNAFRLSEIPGTGNEIKANGENAIVLMPTSYTLELLAPAYKKSIKVNGVELNEGCDGGVKTVTAKLVEGENEIVYSAMDFFGTVVTKNYYIKVVK